MKDAITLAEFIRKRENNKAKGFIAEIYSSVQNKEYADAYTAVILNEARMRLQYEIAEFFINEESFLESLFLGERLISAQKTVDMMCAEVKSCRKEDKMRTFLKAVAYIHGNLTDVNLAVADAARYAGITPAMFSKLFQRYKGITPVMYIGQRRVEESIPLLEKEGAIIKDIALRVGFSSTESYIRAFKKFYMMPPGKWNKLSISQK